MGSFEKTLEKIMRVPTVVDLSPKEIQNFMLSYGFVLKRSKGSHFMYKHPNQKHPVLLVIPMHDPIKPAYIDLIRTTINDIEGE